MNTALALTSSATAFLGLYIYYLHNHLGHATHRLTRRGVVSAQCVSTHNLESLDTDEVFGSGRYLSVYERAWRVVHRAELPGEAVLSKTVVSAGEEKEERGKGYEENLLTAYLRHNMTAFSRYLPQSYLLRLISPQKSTFGAAHIQNLRFCEGDVVCGFYRVLLRRPGKVEFGIQIPDGKFEGRLVIGICEAENQEELEVYSETVMWRAVDKPGAVMPLERGMARFMHELAAWWLLDSGVRYLVKLGKDV